MAARTTHFPSTLSLACAVSLFLHWALLPGLLPLLTPSEPVEGLVSRAIEIALRKPEARRGAGRPQPLAEALQPVVVAGRPIAQRPASDSRRVEVAPDEPVPLEISTASIRTAVQSVLSGAAQETRRQTENGAVVADSELLARLNAAERVIPVDNPFPTVDFAMDGKSIVEFVRVGDACFSIKLADPMRRDSREMWFRIKCPY